MGGRGETAGRKAVDAVRAFICVEVPEATKARIRSLQDGLRRADAQVSWVKPSNVHLTIKFLGDVPAAKVETVRLAVERAASPIRGFEIEVGGAGCFPSPRSPRVLWVGLAGIPESLKQLHAAIEDELAREGFPRESKRFSPHLTIGRIRGPKGASRVAEDLIAAGFEPETFRAREVVVMRSDLNPEGSVYTPQAIIPLKD
ncbi:MAG TPA: RNA 2',3'-cyclic phosphodiesterase [Blastocatellia bacterium]|jgi:2'-5' RNA ligase|nr:RNA 2',3'-cyclic phosphodiesterase [Blastocatellia bacterium]